MRDGIGRDGETEVLLKIMFVLLHRDILTDRVGWNNRAIGKFYKALPLPVVSIGKISI
jgi:hypothetical protein